MNWRYSIELNAVLSRIDGEYDLTEVERDCPEPVKELLALECEKAPPLRSFGVDIRAAKSIAHVNRILSRVFDTADRRSVWCGFPDYSKPSADRPAPSTTPEQQP